MTLGGSVSFDDAFLLRNDTDPTGQVLSVQAVSGGSLKGTVVETSPGNFRYDASSNVAYANTDDNLQYLIRDSDGRVTEGTATVRLLAVGDTNQVPDRAS